MKKLLRRLTGEKLVIEPVVKHSRLEKSTKETVLKLTTLDTIGLVALTMCGLLLSQSMRIGLDNHPTNESENE